LNKLHELLPSTKEEKKNYNLGCYNKAKSRDKPGGNKPKTNTPGGASDTAYPRTEQRTYTKLKSRLLRSKYLSIMAIQTRTFAELK
jgi:hypothetical protein